jgi:hypothetical protein
MTHRTCFNQLCVTWRNIPQLVFACVGKVEEESSKLVSVQADIVGKTGYQKQEDICIHCNRKYSDDMQWVQCAMCHN